MKIRTGHTFTVKESKNLQSDGNETSSSESAESSTMVSARRSTILSCPFNQYSRTPRLAKPVSIPVVPGLKKTSCKENKIGESGNSNLLSISAISVEDYTVLDFSRVFEGTRRTSESSTSLTASTACAMSVSTISQGEKSRLRMGGSGSLTLTPAMERRNTGTNSEDQKDCGYDSIYATPTRYLPRYARHKVKKPTSPPPPPPTNVTKKAIRGF
eukprot:GFUD01018226.1.p1 GENE.GFUD01018226.1~~GFUD01018226.1.p1  ORF type:complete len:214 (+),score=19.95 GFUD01018226.1:153-794(+)